MKKKVGILGATGSVGQKFVQLLENHPDFVITALAASPKSAGKSYGDAVNWFMDSPIPKDLATMTVENCKPGLDCDIVFSGLDSTVAGDIEEDFAKAGYVVLSNSKNHRMDKQVPLIIPEINPDHLDLIHYQSFGKGSIVTNPNCSTIGMVIALKPLLDTFGLEAVQVVTMQALSGAGYPGISSLDIIDNVIPHIQGEEEKMESEPLKIFGRLQNNTIKFADVNISAQCNRVAVIDGHTESISVKLNKKVSKEEIINAWKSYTGEPQKLNLTMAPKQLIHYFDEAVFPQPKRHRLLDKGMAVSIGNLRPCSILDYKFTVLSHNTIRGAAGTAILNAELMRHRGLI